jgi:hypothetical protein
MKKSIFVIILLFCISSMTHGQVNTQIVSLFKKFQEGYTKRDTSQVDKFTSDLCSNDIQLIGTGDNEFMQGIAAAKNLFKTDWMYWFNLNIDTNNIILTGAGNYTFFMVRGTASMSFPTKDAAYSFAMNLLNQSVANEKTPRGKLLAYSSQAANLIQQIESGSLEIKYSIRLSGGLEKKNEKWLFKQIVFSFPYPMTRKN